MYLNWTTQWRVSFTTERANICIFRSSVTSSDQWPSAYDMPHWLVASRESNPYLLLKKVSSTESVHNSGWTLTRTMTMMRAICIREHFWLWFDPGSHRRFTTSTKDFATRLAHLARDGTHIFYFLSCINNPSLKANAWPIVIYLLLSLSDRRLDKWPMSIEWSLSPRWLIVCKHCNYYMGI